MLDVRATIIVMLLVHLFVLGYFCDARVCLTACRSKRPNLTIIADFVA